MSPRNEAWDLTTFLEALTAELDRARDLLRVKSLNRPLTYTVNDVALQLNVFAEYDGDRVRFRTAQAGEQGASQLEMKIGSITDRLVAETTKDLPSEEDMPIEAVSPAVIRPEQQRELKRLGVESKRDLDRLARRKVRHGEVDFAALAARMEQATRPRRRPQIDRAVSFRSPGGQSVVLYGRAMDAIDPGSTWFNGAPVRSAVRNDAVQLFMPGHAAGDLSFRTLDGEIMSLRLLE